jgi:hypothetical protein
MTTAELARPYAPARLDSVKAFFRRHWFEIVLISPLFLYVFGTTLIPVFALAGADSLHWRATDW